MRLLLTLIMAFGMCLTSFGATTTWPASTNAANVFFGNNTFKTPSMMYGLTVTNAGNTAYLYISGNQGIGGLTGVIESTPSGMVLSGDTGLGNSIQISPLGVLSGNGSGLTSLTLPDPMTLNQLNVNTLIVTNAVSLDLSGSTNYYGTNLNKGGSTPGQILTATSTGVGWSNAPASSGGSSNITDSAYIATIRNATISTNLIANGSVIIATNSVGATIKPAIWITNSTDAANNAQQYSPALMFSGQGWDTDGGSTNVSMGFVLEPQQSSTVNGRLYVAKSVAGEAIAATGAYFSSGGNLNASDITAGNQLAGGTILVNTLTYLGSPANGVALFTGVSPVGFNTLILGTANTTPSTSSAQWATTNWPSLHVDSPTNDVTMSARKGTNYVVGDFSSLAAASFVLRTNYSATEFAIPSSTSLAGTSRLVVSNNVLYFVTATKTNLVIDGN